MQNLTSLCGQQGFVEYSSKRCRILYSLLQIFEQPEALGSKNVFNEINDHWSAKINSLLN